MITGHETALVKLRGDRSPANRPVNGPWRVITGQGVYVPEPPGTGSASDDDAQS